MQDLLIAAEAQLGVSFHNKNLLLEALTHRSYLNEKRGWSVGCNERLEFLGDAVVQVIVTEYLLKAFPKEKEGKLTELRAALVCTTVLSELAQDLHLDKHLFLSRGQRKDSERAQQHLGCDAFEAVVGAIYLDQGKEGAERFISRVLLSQLMDIVRVGTKSPKSVLQEFAQEHFALTPSYRVIEAVGEDYNKTFRVAVCLGDNILTTAEGRSKKEAETEAAKVAYTGLRLKLRAIESVRDD